MRLFSVAALCVVVGVVTGLAAGRARWHRVTSPYFYHRLTVIGEHAAQTQSGGLLVIGDSVVERMKFGSVCGPVVNAGVGSSTTEDFRPAVKELVRKARPSRVIVALGNNDVERLSESRFADNMQSIIGDLGGLPVTLVGEYTRKLDRIIRPLGPFVPWPLRDDETFDGVHPTEAGKLAWQRAVLGDCK